MMNLKLPALLMAVIFCATANAQRGGSDWRSLVQRELPTMGHRNWLIVADSAYPEQVSPGVITIYTGESYFQLLSQVLALLKRQRHVAPVVFEDSELHYLTDGQVPGIGVFKQRLGHILGRRPVQTMLHEKMIANLDSVGKTFRVIILKSTLTKPYTSVFMRLDCGYWGDAQEKKLRAIMPGG